MSNISEGARTKLFVIIALLVLASCSPQAPATQTPTEVVIATEVVSATATIVPTEVAVSGTPMDVYVYDDKPQSLLSHPVQTGRVIDGDTVEIDNVTYRIIGIDSPEKDECGWQEATDQLIALLNEYIDIEAHGTDKYARTLAHLSVDGQDVGLAMISDGYAIARYDSLDGYAAHKYQDQYHAQMGYAQANALGIWGVCNGFDTPKITSADPSTPQPEASQDVYYKNCAAAKAAGAAPLHRGDPGYRSGLDRDGDGVACE